MTDTVDGIPLFDSISPEQLGSINLVLACLSDGPRDTEPTLRGLLMRSGVSGGLVNPRDCLRFAIKLGLVDETRGEVRLSTLGQELLAAASWPPYNLLTAAQGRRLLDELVQRPDFAIPLGRLLLKMTRRRDGSLDIVPRSVPLRRDETQSLHAMQSMCAIGYSGGVLVMAPEAYEAVIDVLGTSAVVSEEELIRVLELQRRRAVEAENYVMDLEIERLTRSSRPDLAGLVERIAARDVAAGYDIRSFELDGSDRFIEVKSSTGTYLKFVLSRNERRFLEEHDSTAWIYFVPRVHELPSLSRPVLAMPNPSSWINELATIETQDFLIEFPSTIANSGAGNAEVVWLPRRVGSNPTASTQSGHSVGV
ncbi:MAG: DUF3883 domain-containing protein [Dehalococcoidia bacterium]|nr:DUF3883 domain-containing protein [Dehalococcoidia bacterium]